MTHNPFNSNIPTPPNPNPYQYNQYNLINSPTILKLLYPLFYILSSFFIPTITTNLYTITKYSITYTNIYTITQSILLKFKLYYLHFKLTTFIESYNPYNI
jgi:hypothetical protein